MDLSYKKGTFNIKPISKKSQRIKRVFDFFLSLILLLLTAPVIVICFFLSLIDTKSNGFFVQERVGQYGKIFKIYKIRTMKNNRNKKDFYTSSNDESITYTGKIMRKYKLDEFPQLINILIGDMSFVGPRPDIPGYADNLPDKIRVLLTLKPGITCPASLYLKNEEKILGRQIDKKKYNDEFLWPYKVKSNLKYLEDWSFFYDIKLIFRTICSIFNNIFKKN